MELEIRVTDIEELRQIAQDAIDALTSEESITEQEFGIGSPSEDYYEQSKALQARLDQVLSGRGPTPST